MSYRLTGQFTPRLDEKGRFSFPKGFRDLLGDRVVLTRGSMDGHYLQAYPISVWEETVDKINALPNTRDTRIVRRHLIGSAVEVEIDKLGRVLVSPQLREYAKLESGELVVTGVGKFIEIWDRANFENMEQQDDYDTLVESAMDKIGI